MSDQKNRLNMFEGVQVRTVWDEEHEKWWFSILDVIRILTDQPDYTKVRNYWKWLKAKLNEEGSQLVSNTNQLKLPAADGKKYLTDVADTEQVLRLIQSIPSKKAEPFKRWLARVGRERMDETMDPEQSFNRAIQNYRNLGYDEDWINQRLMSINVRKALTDEWDKSGVKRGEQYSDLTDLMTTIWSGLSTKDYKRFKELKNENLRDNMTNLELVLNMLAEATATEISAKEQPTGFFESAKVAKEGAEVAKTARKKIEERTGQSAISNQNARQIAQKKKPKLS